MSDAFIFKKWEHRAPYYLLRSWDEEKIVAAEITWASVRSKGIRTALAVTFGSGWRSVAKEAGKHVLKYGGRKALGAITGVVCAYFGSAAVCLVTTSTKVVLAAKCVHSVCAGGLDVAELCAATPIHIVEIAIFGRPALIDSSLSFDMLSFDADPISSAMDNFIN